MQDYTFGLTPNLPPPDQSTGNISAQGQPVSTAGTSTTKGSKNVGGATSGVDASNGAITATGTNSLIVDQGVENSIATGISSDTSLENPEHVFSTSQINFVDPQTQIETLGKEIDILNQIGPTFGLASLAVTSGLRDTISSSAAAGKNKGAEGTITEKGERNDHGNKAGGKGKGKNTAEGSSPSAGDSVSRSVSPTGAVTKTVSTQSTNSSGGVTNNTTTTVTGGGSSSSSQGSTSSTSSQSGSTEGTISMTQIMDDIGGLENQESQTMAQQQTSEIDAVELQDKDSIAGANQLIDGANMMMNLAIVGFTCSMLTSAYQIGGIGSASKEGDQAEMESLDEGNQTLTSASESSLHESELATRPGGLDDAAQYNKAQSSIKQMEISTKAQAAKGTISKTQEESLNSQAAASKNALEQSNYQTGGSLNRNGQLSNEDYQKTPAGQKAQTDLAAAKKAGTVDPHTNITTPEEAVKFYQDRAKASNEALKKSIGEYKIALSGKGITEDQARATVQSGWSDTQKEQYQKAVDKDDTKTQAEMLDNPVKALQTNIANIKINRNSQAWQNAYNSRYQEIGIYANTGQLVSQVFNTAGNMESTIGQAEEEKDSASAQVQGSTEQAMSQGVQQTESLAEQLRQSQSEVAQDMQSMVSSTKV